MVAPPPLKLTERSTLFPAIVGEFAPAIFSPSVRVRYPQRRWAGRGQDLGVRQHFRVLPAQDPQHLRRHLERGLAVRLEPRKR